MKQPTDVPKAVLASFYKWCEDHKVKLDDAQLRWDSINGCYWFGHGGVYHGIELDGYLHT